MPARTTNRRALLGSDKRLYAIWRNMRNRCLRPSHPKYARYGARGITIHSPWSDFTTFKRDVLAEIGPPPDGLSLDRRDNDGGYRPGNIRWATQKVQQNNKERSRCKM